MYKLITLDSGIEVIVRLSDNAYIPFDPKNYDYQVYLNWIAQGNKPL